MGRVGRVVAAVVVAVAAVAALAGWLLSPPGDGTHRGSGHDDGVMGIPTTPPAHQAVAPGALLRPAPARLTCRNGAASPFVPTRVSIDGVTTAAQVLPTPRDGNGVPGVPPLTSTGKAEFAWDEPPGVLPGSGHGNVLLNAHTWPDGSALGNRLLAGLDEGDRIVVHGAAGQRLCYHVTERVEVPASPGLARYYEDIGTPQLAIVVCSGRRLGPGDWTHRTVWFARPAPGRSGQSAR